MKSVEAFALAISRTRMNESVPKAVESMRTPLRPAEVDAETPSASVKAP
jgi:hypothetical protein